MAVWLSVAAWLLSLTAMVPAQQTAASRPQAQAAAGAALQAALRGDANQPTITAGSVGPAAVTAQDLRHGLLCQSGAPQLPVQELTIAESHAAMLAGHLTCGQLVDAYLQRIEAFDQRAYLGSIRAINPNAKQVGRWAGSSRSRVLRCAPDCAHRAHLLSPAAALPCPVLPCPPQRAAQLDAELAAMRANRASALPSLFCVPLLVKDNIDVVGLATTAGNAGLADNLPLADARVIGLLQQRGALVLAKASQGEFAFFPSFCLSRQDGRRVLPLLAALLT